MITAELAGLVRDAVVVLILLPTIAGLWGVFAKAGRPGWAALVPVYNVVVLLRIARLPAWMAVLFFFPGINLVALVVASVPVARAFGKSARYGVALGLLFFVFYPVLGFGSARYQPPPGR